MRRDSDIKRDVEEELRSAPSIEAADVAPSVKDGVVMLTGFVHSYIDKFEAEHIAKRVLGVVGVANDLEVRLRGRDERPDPEIARDAVVAIKTRLPLAGQNIKVVVEDGWVTFEGEVEWHYQRALAESTVRWVKGVKGITNLITLRPGPARSPDEIRRKIEEAFRRSAEIDANRVTVETHSGEVILKGAVRSWAERQEAGRVAWTTLGVTNVDNRLAVSV